MSQLNLPPATGDLILNNLIIVSGCVGYVDFAYDALSPSGLTIEQFVVREIVEQSIRLYAGYIVNLNYENTIASGNTLEINHGGFAAHVGTERKNMIADFEAQQ